MVKIQIELSEKADAVASYEKALRKHETKAGAVNALLEQMWRQLK